jgi:type II secretory pathway pseudopilin PulG
MISFRERLSRLTRRAEGGFSLVEVIVAMALLGTVIIAIMSLFFLGRRTIYSGRQMTKAIALGNRVMEDLSLLTKQDVYSGSFGILDTDTGSSVTIMGTTYPNAKIRSTDPAFVTSPPQSDIQTVTAGGPDYLNKWTAQLGNDLQNGSVTLILQPQPDSAATTFAGGQLLRMTVLILWKESTRQRSLTLTSVKAY